MIDSSSGAPRGRPAGVLLLVARLVLGEDAVEPAAGLGEEVDRALALLGGAGLDDLHRRGAERHHEVAQLAGLLGEAAADGLPGLTELVAACLDVLAAGVGEGEHAPRALLGGLDEALVLQLRERG